MNATDRKDLSQYAEASATESGTKWEGHMADDVSNTGGPDPMALLIATSEALLLRSTRGNFRLPRTGISRLGRGNLYPWLFSAMRIHHTIPGVPRELQFKPLNKHWKAVQAELKSLGYPVG